MVSENSKKMIKAFESLKDFGDAALKTSKIMRLFITCLEFLPNPNRKWWHFWKPKTIKNPDYNLDPVEFDIVRGNIK